MHKTTTLSLLILAALGLSACGTGGNLSNLIPDRRPDYRSSSVGNALEIPPDLTGASIDNAYNIPGLSTHTMASYNAYNDANLQRDKRGFIKVLPPLQGVQVVEQRGALPYIVVDAGADQVWQAVKRYWNQNGIRLAVQDPAIGIMETDWLINKAELPSTGISSFLDDLLGFVSDSGQRDRYRIRFTRDGQNHTLVTLIYTQSVEKAEYNGVSKREASGYSWQLSDNDNPELQLEMTRRLALYIANQLARQTPNNTASTTENTQQPYAQIGRTQQGAAVLILNGNYDQAWRAVGIGLDKASFAIQKSDYKQGLYRVQYQPQSEAKRDPGLWNKLWGKKTQNNVQQQPIFLIRLVDQNKRTVAIVQTENGRLADNDKARAILTTIRNNI